MNLATASFRGKSLKSQRLVTLLNQKLLKPYPANRADFNLKMTAVQTTAI
jgi:hypothetical protein